MGEFEKRGLRVAAISVDPADVSQKHCRKMGFTFPLLADTDAAVIRRYDLLHPRAGPKSSDIARPAEFLVDAAGMIRWANLAESVTVRTRPEQVLRAFDESIGASAP